jgi:hypothetical protein
MPHVSGVCDALSCLALVGSVLAMKKNERCTRRRRMQGNLKQRWRIVAVANARQLIATFGQLAITEIRSWLTESAIDQEDTFTG